VRGQRGCRGGSSHPVCRGSVGSRDHPHPPSHLIAVLVQLEVHQILGVLDVLVEGLAVRAVVACRSRGGCMAEGVRAAHAHAHADQRHADRRATHARFGRTCSRLCVLSTVMKYASSSISTSAISSSCMLLLPLLEELLLEEELLLLLLLPLAPRLPLLAPEAMRLTPPPPPPLVLLLRLPWVHGGAWGKVGELLRIAILGTSRPLPCVPTPLYYAQKNPTRQHLPLPLLLVAARAAPWP